MQVTVADHQRALDGRRFRCSRDGSRGLRSRRCVLGLVKELAEVAVARPDAAVHEPVQYVTGLAGPDQGLAQG